MLLNHDIKGYKCLVRLSHFTKKKTDENTFHEAYAFAIQSLSSKILTFHVMTDYGMLRSRVPISEIFFKIPTKDIPYYYKQLWDCFSENVSVIHYDFLEYHRAQIVLRDGSKVWGQYMFTVGWYSNPYSDEPTDYKCGHIFSSDDGYLLCMPNNRIYWRDSNWVTKDFPVEPKDIKVDTEHLSVESVADRWIIDDTDSFYY